MSNPPINRQPSDVEQPHEPPASVVFMEMMRRAASVEPEPTPDDVPVSADLPAEPETTAPPNQPMSEAERQQLASLEAERLRRVQRRKDERDKKRAGMLGGVISSWFIVIVAGALIATILSWGTSPDSLSTDLRSEIGRITNQQNVALVGEVGTAIPTPNYAIKIGIVSGHMGNDSGAVCPEGGPTEAEINYAVAERLLYQLAARGYEVDLLEEYDRRLRDYRATFVFSIHSNDCRAYTGGASGFLIAKADHRSSDGEDTRLVECVGNAYEGLTGLTRRYGLTRDMEDYHVFNRIHPTTPGAIIELGFMRDDGEFLVNNQDLMADAILAGVDCFLRYENPFTNPTPTNPMIDAMTEATPEDE